MLNIFLKKKRNKGFTLIELLVVMAIIGVLSSAVFASLGAARTKARNVKRLRDISQWNTAMESHQNEFAEYPDTNVLNTSYCLGDYADNLCWGNGTAIGESAALATALTRFISPLSSNEGVIGGYEGAIYACTTRTSNRCLAVQVQWVMEGANQSCGVGVVANANLGGNNITLCHLNKP